MELKIATIEHLEILTQMNIQLREDEQIDNIMSEKDVRDRMEGFLNGLVYKAILFIDNNKTLGYCLIDFTKKPLYLRQIFINRKERSTGLGKIFLRMVMAKYDIKDIDVEVMVWNEKAIKFYTNFGFKKRFIGMNYKEI
jgi:ribosomal protein S18 acetylase RimI-like enzyme